jgi:hypothetical protein
MQNGAKAARTDAKSLTCQLSPEDACDNLAKTEEAAPVLFQHHYKPRYNVSHKGIHPVHAHSWRHSGSDAADDTENEAASVVARAARRQGEGTIYRCAHCLHIYPFLI